MVNEEWLTRTKLLLGEEKLSKLINAHVLIVGLGGVGASAAEQLCRAGIGKLSLIDNDRYQASNRNRQLTALISTEGHKKTEAVKNRLLDINDKVNITTHTVFLDDKNLNKLITQDFDYIVDAIDTLTPKIELIRTALKMTIPLVSSMGSGGKTDPQQVQISDVSDSYGCKLAFMLRKRLHRFGIYDGFKVVFSPEKINRQSVIITKNEKNKKSNVGTISYMPAIFGCFMASVVINDLIVDKA